MDKVKEQLNKYLCGEELIKELTVLPPYREGLVDVPYRLTALLDIYKIYIPSSTTLDTYNRLYMAILNSLEKKATLLEVGLQNDNFRSIKGNKRYGIIGGLESFKITGTAGLGKTSTVQRCLDIIADKILISQKPYREIIPACLLRQLRMAVLRAFYLRFYKRLIDCSVRTISLKISVIEPPQTPYWLPLVIA